MVSGSFQPPPPNLQEEKEAVAAVAGETPGAEWRKGGVRAGAGQRDEDRAVTQAQAGMLGSRVEQTSQESPGMMDTEEEENTEGEERKDKSMVMGPNSSAKGCAREEAGDVGGVGGGGRGGKFEPEISAAPAPSRRTIFADLRHTAARSAPPALESDVKESDASHRKGVDGNAEGNWLEYRQAEPELLAGGEDSDRERLLPQGAARALLSLVDAQEAGDEEAAGAAGSPPILSLKQQLMLEASILSPIRLSPRRLSDRDKEEAQAPEPAPSIWSAASARSPEAQAANGWQEQAAPGCKEQGLDAFNTQSQLDAFNPQMLKDQLLMEASILSPRRLSPRGNFDIDKDEADTMTQMDLCLPSAREAATSSDNVRARQPGAAEKVLIQKDVDFDVDQRADLEAGARQNDQDSEDGYRRQALLDAQAAGNEDQRPKIDMDSKPRSQLQRKEEHSAQGGMAGAKGHKDAREPRSQSLRAPPDSPKSDSTDVFTESSLPRGDGSAASLATSMDAGAGWSGDGARCVTRCQLEQAEPLELWRALLHVGEAIDAGKNVYVCMHVCRCVCVCVCVCLCVCVCVCVCVCE